MSFVCSSTVYSNDTVCVDFSLSLLIWNRMGDPIFSFKSFKSVCNTPVAQVTSPHSSPNRGSDNDHELPEPDRCEHCPVTPLDNSIQLQSQQDGEQQKGGINEEFAVTEREEAWLDQYDKMCTIVTNNNTANIRKLKQQNSQSHGQQ